MLALADCGAVSQGQTPRAEDINRAFTRMNWMLAQWNRRRWLIWHLLDLHVVSTGAQTYTVGPGGAINTPVRPDRLEDAFFRQLTTSQPSQVDYPVRLLQSREDYNKISLKQLTSFQEVIFYDSAWPTGVIYPWPIPQASIYEIHITVKDVLNQFTSLSQPINLPDEYYEAIYYNLMVRLGIAYPIAKDPQIWEMTKGLARSALNTIRGANTQIASLRMPTDLLRPGVYNPYSDQIR